MKVQAETTVRPSLMTIEQAGERLGVSTRHMRRLVAERRIPYVKWGHLLRFDPLAIDEALVRFRPDGALNGFTRKVAETYVRDAATGQVMTDPGGRTGAVFSTGRRAAARRSRKRAGPVWRNW